MLCIIYKWTEGPSISIVWGILIPAWLPDRLMSNYGAFHCTFHAPGMPSYPISLDRSDASIYPAASLCSKSWCAQIKGYVYKYLQLWPLLVRRGEPMKNSSVIVAGNWRLFTLSHCVIPTGKLCWSTLLSYSPTIRPVPSCNGTMYCMDPHLNRSKWVPLYRHSMRGHIYLMKAFEQ